MPTFSIQYASDLHLEQYDVMPPNLIVKSSDNLALVGDIGDPYSKMYLEFLKEMSLKFETVFILNGNHEFYNHDYNETKIKIGEVIREFENIYFMDNDVYDFENVRIIGSTLWSDITLNASRYINDYRRINMGSRKLSREDTVEFFNDSVKYIKTKLDVDKPVIILTHHAPHPIMNGIFEGNRLQSAFSTDLSYLLKKPVIAWICGHTHQTIETTINEVKLCSNQLGYKDENTGYKNNKVLELY